MGSPGSLLAAGRYGSRMQTPVQSSPLWNSLEIAKLVASILTPLMVTVFGILIHRLTKRIESHEWLNQKVVEKRLAVYDELAPLLNDLLCYFTYIGTWKERRPPEIVDLKRDLDRRAHVAAPLFSPAFINAYNQFIGCCFDTYQGWGADAKLKTDPSRRRDAFGAGWKAEWNDCFAGVPCPPQAIRTVYQGMMSVFTKEFGLDFQSPIPAGRPPANWKPESSSARAGS